MKTAKTNRKYMYVNVILTFNTMDKHGGTQELFDLNIPISKQELSAAEFMHTKFFKRVAKKITLLKREAGHLVKISTAADWDLFEEITGLDSLCTLGHSCKWFFGNGRDDLDSWEEVLMYEFKFGTKADMSYVSLPETKAMMANFLANCLSN